MALGFFSAFLYRYLYQSHRDISREGIDFELTTKQLYAAFNKDEVLANKTYLDKVLLISGFLTTIDSVNQSIILDEHTFISLKDQFRKTKIDTLVKVKAKVVGYDELLEQVTLDQGMIVTE